MGGSWNVKNPQVFDELANNFRQTVPMLKDIWTETDVVARKTIEHCNQAITSKQARISKLESDLRQLESEQRQLERAGASASQAHVESEIRAIKAKLREETEDLRQIERLRDNFIDSKHRYDSAFNNKEADYRDEVNKNCMLLNQFGILLARSRMGQ